MKKITEIAKQLAATSLEIGAIELRPKKPFQWASGTFNPIYNDNRMLLGNYDHRMLVANGIKEILEEMNLGNYYLCGTSLSGIAPAESVRELTRGWAELLYLSEGKIYIQRYPYSFGLSPNASAIASTAPWMIPIGVAAANHMKLPFMYIRPERKEHGKQKLIEGNPKSGERIEFFCTPEEDIFDLQKRLAEEGILFSDEKSPTRSISRFSKEKYSLELADLNKYKVIVIEDLISTGGSALKEVNACRNAGAEVLGVISIFNYGLESAQKVFKDADCPVHSVLSYDTLLEVAKEKNMFSSVELETLREWRNDQPNWGDTHGFPKVEKATA